MNEQNSSFLFEQKFIVHSPPLLYNNKIPKQESSQIYLETLHLVEMLSELDVFISNYIIVDPEIYQLWIEGYTSECLRDISIDKVAG